MQVSIPSPGQATIHPVSSTVSAKQAFPGSLKPVANVVLFGSKGYRNPSADPEVIEASTQVANNLLMGKPLSPETWKVLLKHLPPAVGRIPFISRLRQIPGISHRCGISKIDLPTEDLVRLREAVNPKTAGFMAPLHPEPMTDWLMDKHLSTLVAPQMASFAAAAMVQIHPDYLLKNNIIANNGGAEAQAYAVDWAMKGHGVLMHPEGMVHWNGNVVRQLMPGIVHMAMEAARRATAQGLERPVYIAPIVWKYRFDGDVRKELLKDIADLEKRLDLPRGSKLPLPMRFYQLHQNLLTQRYKVLGLEESPHLADKPYFYRAEAFLNALYRSVSARYTINLEGTADQKIHRFEKAIKATLEARKAQLQASAEAATSSDPQVLQDILRRDPLIATAKSDLKKVTEMRRLNDFQRAVYGRNPSLSQEEVAESLKAIRGWVVQGTTGLYNSLIPGQLGRKVQNIWDQFNDILPKPVGTRTAHIRVGKPIDVTAALQHVEEGIWNEKQVSGALLKQVASLMQKRLDELNQEIEPQIKPYRIDNLFYIPL